MNKGFDHMYDSNLSELIKGPLFRTVTHRVIQISWFPFEAKRPLNYVITFGACKVSMIGIRSPILPSLWIRPLKTDISRC